jgi:hypothetical protein
MTASVLAILMIVSTVGGALNGKGSRALYFDIAVAAGVCGVIVLSLMANPVELLSAIKAQRMGAEVLEDYATGAALVLLATAFGSAVGGCIFRMPKDDE